MPGKPRNEDLIPVEKVPALVLELTGVTRGKPLIYSWIRKGRISQHGQIVKLKATKRLGTWFTTKEWLMNFINEVG
jgi:hypothetical protein